MLNDVLEARGFVVTIEAQQEHVVRPVRLQCVWEVTAVQSGYHVETREVLFSSANDALVLTIKRVVLIIHPHFITYL